MTCLARLVSNLQCLEHARPVPVSSVPNYHGEQDAKPKGIRDGFATCTCPVIVAQGDLEQHG